MKGIKSDSWLAVCVLVLAAVYLYMDAHLPDVRLSDPLGPKAFPALVGVGLIASALILLLETRGKKRLQAQCAAAQPVAQVAAQPAAGSVDSAGNVGNAGNADHTGAPDEAYKPRVLLGMIAWTALYDFCFERAGYLIATSVFLFGLLSYFNRNRLKTNLAISLGVTVTFYLAFSHLLGVPMPTGPLPF
jgi:putative tricarboxylic transport membrane protein